MSKEHLSTSLLSQEKASPFLEQFGCVIFDAGTYSVDALQFLAWLPNARKVVPLSAKKAGAYVQSSNFETDVKETYQLLRKKDHIPACLNNQAVPLSPM
jgi:hypothetical protein